MCASTDHQCLCILSWGEIYFKLFGERNKIIKEQEKWQAEKRKQKFFSLRTLKLSPMGRARIREIPAYNEQGGKCAYSLVPLDVTRLVEPGYVEIDHALPYARSFDDSQNNKALVLKAENQNKKNQTPFEYLDGANNSERWLNFSVWVDSNKSFRRAKRERLLRRNFDERDAKEFSDRNLNDTRYIASFAKNFIEHNLALSGHKKDDRVICVNGQFTSFLRVHWGLLQSARTK